MSVKLNKTEPIVYKLNDKAKFPMFHLWVSNNRMMNLYSNVNIRVGDKIRIGDKRVTVVSFDSVESTTKNSAYFIKPETVFYSELTFKL